MGRRGGARVSDAARAEGAGRRGEEAGVGGGKLFCEYSPPGAST